MIDGLGLVFEKQGNTGAAAYNNPEFRIGANPLDRMANEAFQANLLKQAQEQKAKQAQEQKNYRAIEKLNPKFWTIDETKYFNGRVQGLRDKAFELSQQGKDLNNLSDPQVYNWHQEKAKLDFESKLSQEQEKLYNTAIQKVAMDKSEEYDKEETIKNLDAYRLLSPAERADITLDDMVVKGYDKYQGLKDLPANAFTAKISTSYSGPTGGSSKSYNTFEEDKAKQYFENYYTTEEGKRQYDFGVKKGWWKTPEEAVTANVEQAKLGFNPDVSNDITVKDPNDGQGMTFNFISGSGNTGELMDTIGAKPTSFKVMGIHGNAPTTVISGTDRAINLTALNATIPAGGAISVVGNKPNREAIKVEKGLLLQVPVATSTTRGVDYIIPLNDKGYTKDKPYKVVSNGKTYEFSGTRQEVLDQLQQNGLARIENRILTIAGGKDYWIDPNKQSVISGVSDNTKALDGNQQALAVFNEDVKRKNQKYRKAKPAAPAKSPAKKQMPTNTATKKKKLPGT